VGRKERREVEIQGKNTCFDLAAERKKGGYNRIVIADSKQSSKHGYTSKNYRVPSSLTKTTVSMRIAGIIIHRDNYLQEDSLFTCW
jgi:hypothetical protein